MARVKETHTGEDDHVRVVMLQTEKGTYRRPITRLVPLLTKENDLDLPKEPFTEDEGPIDS